MSVSTPVPDAPPASPDSLEYTEAVWSLALREAGQPASVPPDAVGRELHADPWVRRYLECAARSLAGRAPGGGSRTAWLSAQRRARADGALPAGRVALLERLAGFTWTPDEDRWRAGYLRVADFVSEHGRIPGRGDDPRLASWLAGQRLAVRRGRVDDVRAVLLSGLRGWAESLDTARSRQVWEATLERLRAFLADGDGCYPAPDAADHAEAELAAWAQRQRDCHRRRDLSARRVAQLEALPKWRWSARDAAFDWRICELRRELAGAPIPSAHPLYHWVLSQRRRHRDGRLTDEQVADLAQLGLLTAP